MPDQDKDAFEEGQPNEFMPGEEDFEDEFEGDEGDEEEEALEEAPEEAPARSRARAREEAAGTGRRFRFGRGGGEEAVPAHSSLRAQHERVHVDDRASAVFALLCALGLVGILLVGFLGQYAPKGGDKPLPTLDLRTFVAPSPTASSSASASLAPTATPTVAPTASPSAS